MRHLRSLLLLALSLPSFAIAQSACSPGELAQAANVAIATRHQLRAVAVGEDDPAVPPAVVPQLARLRDSLAQAAEAAFACAPVSATPDELQETLADALYANLTTASETVLVTRSHKDLGAYGSALAVQVIPLYNSPKYVEVDFRYGVECGDDNLMIVFEADGSAGAGWHEVLRWGPDAYSNVRGAFGDFVLLTPLSGFPGQRNWRFVVAHGQPECSAGDAPSRFDLDVLEPAADPADPKVVWHLERTYRRNAVPSLSTTEDTLTLALSVPEKSVKAPAHADTYRFRIGKNNQVMPLTTPDGDAPQTASN